MCFTRHCRFAFTHKTENKNVFFEVKTISKPNICSPEALLSFTDINPLNIPVFNSSLEEIFISANSQFAAIEICEESFEVFHINFSSDHTFSIQSNNLCMSLQVCLK